MSDNNREKGVLKVSLVRSKQRVADHGEVFTPAWMVSSMLDLVKNETQRIDSRFLESSCGSGNFLVEVLRRKLAEVDRKYGKSDFEKTNFALFGLMCIYGIELLADNAEECRQNLFEIFIDFLKADPSGPVAQAATAVLDANIVQGDALTLKTTDGSRLIFPEWSYLGTGKFSRRDFGLDILMQRSALEGTLFENFEEHDIFIPVAEYETLTVQSIPSAKKLR